MRKFRLSTLLALIALLISLISVNAKGPPLPDLIQLPVGFRPEGIAVGRGSTFFTGSLANGAIYRGNLQTGEGAILVPGETGMVSVGMAFDGRSNRLFVAGGPTGLARVYNASTGELVKTYTLSPTGSFINDVVITRQAAYFTNSNEAILYRLPLGSRGNLPLPASVEALPLTGDWQQVAGFNANGIESSPNYKWLIVVNSTTGNLYRVDPATGLANLIDLGGESVSAGDGLLFRGSLLYVVRNFLNEIVAVDLSADLTSGDVVDRLINPNLNVPTTIGSFGGSLFAVNAKFGAPSPATIPYEIVRLSLD